MAIPLVLVAPELLPIMVGVAALLLAWAVIYIFQKPIVWVLSQIPVVGGALADGVGNLIYNVSQFVVSAVNGAIQPLVDVLDFIVGIPVKIVQLGTIAVYWVSGNIRGLWSQLTAGLSSVWSSIGSILSQAATLASQVAGQAARIAAQAGSIAYIIATAIPLAISRAVAAAEAWASAQIKVAVSTLHGLLLALESRVLAMVGAEAAARAAADAATRAFAAARATEVAAANAAAIAAERAYVGLHVGQLGQAIDGIESQIGNIALPLTITGTIAIATAEIARIARCTDPVCGYIGPQLAALEAIQDAGLLALLTGAVVAASRDPEGAARETVHAIRPLEDMVGGLLRDLTGKAA